MGKLQNKKVTQVSPAGRVLARDKTLGAGRIDIESQRAAHKKATHNIEPYIILKYGNQSYKSPVSYGLDPVFENAQYTFHYKEKNKVKVSVYDEDKGVADADDLIGEGNFDVPEVSNIEKEISVKLSGINDATFMQEFRGDAFFKIMRSSADDFQIKVIKAEHLKNVDQADTADIAQNLGVVLWCLFLFILYLAAGTLVFPLLETDWTYIDSAYFAVVTLTTVGYGDLLPTTPLSKAVVVLYGLLGIVYIGAAVGIIGSAIMEQMNKKMAKMSKVVPPNARKKIEEKGNERKSCCSCTSRAKGRLRTIFTSLLLITVNVGGGAAFLFLYEGQDLGDMIYLGFISLLTIGYGDFSPQTQVGRFFAIFWIMLGTVIVANFLGIFAGFIIEDKQEKLRDEILTRKLDSNTLKNWDKDGDNTIDRFEYLTARLLQLEICNQFEINNIMETFDLHDHNGDGTVTISDILKSEGLA